MYPEDILIYNGGKRIVSFEKDINNPENEGFICFWKINELDNYELIFKKRISKMKAIKKLKTLKKMGWKKNHQIIKAA
tara:strand:+ start:315 stop:548 length:234 start_codon:yes stop_codon:yes gene_type:complete